MPETRPSRIVAASAVAACALVVGAVSFWWWWSRANAPAPDANEPTTATPATDREPDAANSQRTGPAEDRAAAPTPTAATFVVLRGRCLAAEDDSPLAAVLHVGADDGTADGSPGGLLTRALATTTTDAEGRFTCKVPIAAATELRALATAPDRAPGTSRRTADPGTEWDVGDIRLVRTSRVLGTVVDTTGAQVPDVAVTLLMNGHEPLPFAFRDLHTANTDARGAFTMPEPLAAGEWYVMVERTGALRNPRKVQVPAGVDHHVLIEVERPDPAMAIHGKVVDRAGAPLAGIALSAYGEGSRGRAESGPDGTFVLHRGPPHFDRGVAGVELQAQGTGLEQVGPAAGQPARWSQRDVVVVMRPLAEITVRAQNARGAPVWPFAVVAGQFSASGNTWNILPARRQRLGTDHIVLLGLQSGRHSLLLQAQDGALPTAGPVVFVVDEAAPRELVIQVPDPVVTVVEVVDGAGTPVPGCTVELVSNCTAQPPSATAPAATAMELRRQGPRGSKQVVLGGGTTDTAGNAAFAAPPGTLLLRTSCRTHLPDARTVVIAAPSTRVRVALSAATVVRGRLVPATALPTLGLHETKPERRLAVTARGLVGGVASELARAEVDADGTFVLGPVPPGPVTLRLHSWLTVSTTHGASAYQLLGEFDTTGQPVVEREYDVSPFLPATASGVVLLDGQPLRSGQFFLRRLRLEPRQHVRINTDAEGRFHTLVPPGALGVQLAIPANPGPGHVIVPMAEEWQVAAGGALELRIEGRRRLLRLRALQPDGAPLANARLRITSVDFYDRPGSTTTDAAGRVDLDIAPLGTFLVGTKTATGVDLEATVTVALGDEERVVDVPLVRAPR